MSADPLAAHARGILDHMNRDHAGALALLARHFGATSGDSATMAAVDATGFDVVVRAGEESKRVRIGFPRPSTTPDAVRRVLIEMLAEARRVHSTRGP